MPFNELKLDMSFVSILHENEDARKMVRIMVYLAHELGMISCAEGVENQEILDFLASIGCDKVQGYFISRPVPADEFESFVKKWGQKT